ncbi:SWIM zinc finger family protein [Streptomyces sp.]|uniref:SWIM zinc finger family protein n=1 Tax=Streptomyces sp. TaxID=1931 RepID=UPI002811FCB1|nr:SWIM zinc finger family protein [Streptomyces sp.]
MTPRPSDEAREALRAARERADREPVATAGTPDRRTTPGTAAGRSERPADREHRPGDAAREALRRAVRSRRGVAPAAGEAGDPGGENVDASVERGTADAPEVASPEVVSPAAVSPAVGDAPSDDAPTAAGHGAEGAAHRPAQRPGDIAREALRSAREERARTETDDRERRAEPRRRRAPSPVPRVPRTTRGDRTADVRARGVRESLTGAFRMPDPADEPEQAPGAGPHRSTPAPGAPGSPGTRRDTGPGTAPPAPPASHAAPHAVPRSMAAPARDGDLRRTFPAFPPRTRDGEGFAETWWGNAWVTALEEGALDAARLARGRGYAEQGHVDAITVTPGLVLAYVRGSRPRPYRVQVRLRTFGDADWERFLDAAADRPGHIAALLDKEMPQSLADCGAPLLPAPGDLDPRCSCPDSGHPCKHAAALCYQTARLLDADPFVLLLLRGRGEREVIDALSRLSAARAARAAREKEPEPLPGVRAADALAPRALPPLPAPLPPPAHPGPPPVYPASPGGPDPFALDQLATDAAARAHALLTTGRDPVGGLTLWQDAVRLAAGRPGSGLTAATRALYSSLATAAGRTPAELARAVAAWRQGGPTGLAVLEEPWDPPAGRFDRARPLLLAADLPAFRPRHNRLTHPRGHVQLRLGRDNLWYAYESEPGHDDWWPRGTPDPDPVGALTGLDTLGDP